MLSICSDTRIQRFGTRRPLFQPHANQDGATGGTRPKQALAHSSHAAITVVQGKNGEIVYDSRQNNKPWSQSTCTAGDFTKDKPSFSSPTTSPLTSLAPSRVTTTLLPFGTAEIFASCPFLSLSPNSLHFPWKIVKEQVMAYYGVAGHEEACVRPQRQEYPHC
jgi:hypothetical protein